MNVPAFLLEKEGPGTCHVSLFPCAARSLRDTGQFSSVAPSCLTLRPHGLQHARPPCPSPIPRVYPNSFHQVSGAIQPSHPLLSPSPPALNLAQNQGLFQ